jgi:hypothetical protein
MDYIKIRPLTIKGNAFATENEADHAICARCWNWCAPFLRKPRGAGYTVEVILKVTLTSGR